jgi:hypothetical protein
MDIIGQEHRFLRGESFRKNVLFKNKNKINTIFFFITRRSSWHCFYKQRIIGLLSDVCGDGQGLAPVRKQRLEKLQLISFLASSIVGTLHRIVLFQAAATLYMVLLTNSRPSRINWRHLA